LPHSIAKSEYWLWLLYAPPACCLPGNAACCGCAPDPPLLLCYSLYSSPLAVRGGCRFTLQRVLWRCLQLRIPGCFRVSSEALHSAVPQVESNLRTSLPVPRLLLRLLLSEAAYAAWCVEFCSRLLRLAACELSCASLGCSALFLTVQPLWRSCLQGACLELCVSSVLP
jgi:hypothetical protein